MTAIQTLAGILGLAFVSGINLYAAVLVVGLGIRYHWLTGLPPELHVLANPAVIVVAACIYVLEFVVDKVPFVSVAWDAIHTFIRPLGGALLALGMASNASPPMQVVAFLVGGSVALGTHSSKMGIRLLAHSSPEPVSHSILSVGEDLSVVGLLTLLYTHAAAALAVFAALVATMLVVTPFLYRVLFFILRGIYGGLVAWIPKRGQLVAPAWLESRLAEISTSGDHRLFRCFARSFPKAPKLKYGYLIWTGIRPYFAYRTLMRSKLVPIGIDGALETTLATGALFDILGLQNARGASDSVYLSKDWSAMFQRESAANQLVIGSRNRGPDML